VWKNNPLPFHANAALAAEAAMEAQAQGRFWEMHDVLFQNPYALGRYDLERYAASVGLDMVRFRNALDTHAHQPTIAADAALARSLGATGTPAFYINGTPLAGAQRLERFTALIDRVLYRARTIVPPEGAYAQMTLAPEVDPGAPPVYPGRVATPPRAALDPSALYNVPVTSAQPARGRVDALVTVVMIGDLQCPFCARAVATLDTLRGLYGDDVRIVWRNNPLPFHAAAMPAAEAAVEARAQRGDAGFWRLHDAVYTNQRAGLSAPLLERLAVEQGLDVARLRAALADHRHEATVRADMALAARLGATGTPTFFINGRPLTGAQPVERFVRLVDEARVAAAALVRAGVPRALVYDRTVGAGHNGVAP
jgi:protein-disulfide isomerase